MNDPLSNWLRRINPIWFVLVILAASYVVLLPFVGLATLIPALEQGEGAKSIRSNGLAAQFIIVAIIGPLLETALNQQLTTWLFRTKLQLKWPIVIFLSAAFFGALHWYSLGYVIFAFHIGLLLAYAYGVLMEKPNGWPFLSVFIIHAVRNGIAIATVYFLP